MKVGWVSVVGQLIGQVLGECLGPPEHVRSDNYVRPRVCICVCSSAAKELSAPNCCLLSHCQSDYEILFNLLGGRVFCDFDESDLLFLHSLYCLVVRCRVLARSSVLRALSVPVWIQLPHTVLQQQKCEEMFDTWEL